MMRITLTIDDVLLRIARQRAEQQGRPLAELINRALQRGLAEIGPDLVAQATLVYGDSTAAGPDDSRLGAWMRRLDDGLDHAGR